MGSVRVLVVRERNGDSNKNRPHMPVARTSSVNIDRRSRDGSNRAHGRNHGNKTPSVIVYCRATWGAALAMVCSTLHAHLMRVLGLA